MQEKITELARSDLAPLLNQAVLNPHLEEDIFNQICDASKHLGFGGLCTSLNRLPLARERLGKTCETKLITVISFPFGDIPKLLKLAQAEWAIEHGAEELEVVPNFDFLNKGDTNSFGEELFEICSLGLPVRTILDMQNLSPPNLKIAVQASLEAGVIGFQTGNGFGRIVTLEDIKNLVNITGQCSQIKAVGGMHTLEKTLEVLHAGATLVGTSKGPEIMQFLRNK
ncbi:2-deoxyribose-5-phosphate aldolase [Prochlorococcus sp. MIT 1341]|uniref:2-deoxyribose-5-phosphate aldolase n=1 Tax=Prochlorococcus sp. MIT 1341 TaxID=3096221 RepID=UPI002A751A2E|nr:2-deoxyribose-5-phosphate aldolase [Prochlorococcus sp. MIT 1341]